MFILIIQECKTNWENFKPTQLVQAKISKRAWVL